MSGYNLYLMREPAIGEREWLDFVQSRAGFRRESQADSSEPIAVLDLSPTTTAGFYWIEPGEVLVRVDPVDTEDIATLVSLATDIGARVEGADGEIWGPDGH